MSYVKLFKLSNGEEIVARKKGELDSQEAVILEQPMVIQAVPSEQKGRIGIALIPWIVGAEENIKVNLTLDHILVETDPKETIEKNYLSKLTGLTL